jgi:hypothetical protein
MAEEKKGEEKKGEKKARKHLHEIRTTATDDGHFVHHHTYKAKKGDTKTEPERQNVATSSSPEEAGEHVQEQMAMNQGGATDPGAADAGADAGAGAAPDAGGGAMPGA